MKNLDKALLVANARVAVLQGANRTWCVGGDFVCDIPGYHGYDSGWMALSKAGEDLGVEYSFLDGKDNNVKFHANIAMDNGVVLGLTVPLPVHDTDSVQVAVITVLHLYWLSKQTGVQVTRSLVDELAGIFDVSFGTGQMHASQ